METAFLKGGDSKPDPGVTAVAGIAVAAAGHLPYATCRDQ